MRTSTVLKREPVENASLLDACDRVNLSLGTEIVVKRLRFHQPTNHWQFELDQRLQGQERPGTWYAYTHHVFPQQSDRAIPTAFIPNEEYNSGELVATQDTFLKRTMAKQSGELVTCDKLPLAARQRIRIKHILPPMQDESTGEHLCFELDGSLGGEDRLGLWYAWVPAVEFYPFYRPLAAEGQDNLIQA